MKIETLALLICVFGCAASCAWSIPPAMEYETNHQRHTARVDFDSFVKANQIGAPVTIANNQ